MAKVAIVVLAGTETHEGLGRVVNALEAVKEFKEAQDEVKLIFDGAGSAWVPELAKQDHKANRLFAAVRDRVSGVCAYCGVRMSGVRGAPLRPIAQCPRRVSRRGTRRRSPTRKQGASPGRRPESLAPT